MGIRKYDGEPFELNVPVCVVGGGACGLTAAVSAARAGADVVVFERDATPSGSTAMTIGLICAAGTRQQAQLGIPDSGDDLFKDIMTATRGQTDEGLARMLAMNSGPTMDWLCDEVGCDFTLETNWPGYGHGILRAHGTPNRTGEELIAMLMRAAVDAGVEIITQATVTDLIVDDNQKVVGLSYTSPDGEVSVGCDAVVLASSGFGADREMVSRFIPEMSDAVYYGCENHRGDAIKWGEALGAEIADTGSYQGVGTHLVSYNFGIPHTVMIDGGIKVNVDGHRFENELDNISVQAVTLTAQPGSVGWIIYDERGHQKALSLFEEYRRNAPLIVQKAKAEGVKDLAAITKIPEASLQTTLDELDSLAASGLRGPFGRTFLPEERLCPPYYAVKVTGALYHTQGGLCIDDTARVRRKGGGVFENLFAGGGAARSVSGPSDWGYLPAMGLATAVVFGRIAGHEAALAAMSTAQKTRAAE
ncbi:MAG: FAD-dependent oxidoreductase [Hyphomonas sp.]|nr:FAD-dependent oxidoreductase [Hyphomonas sp.]